MDTIQKVLIKAGRKDLAQEYYKKIAADLAQEYYQKVAVSFPGRAWSGKLEKVDHFLSSVYDQMSTNDKELKDKVFHAYYRHYNDGDFKSLPYSQLKKLGMTEDEITKLKNARSYKSPEAYQAAIEKAVDVTMSYLLKKYKSAISHGQVHLDKLKGYEKFIRDNDYKQSYWIDQFGKEGGIPELIDLAKKLKDLNKGVSLTKDLKSLPEDDVATIRRLIRKRLEDKEQAITKGI